MAAIDSDLESNFVPKELDDFINREMGKIK